jgi:hypothetical protein
LPDATGLRYEGSMSEFGDKLGLLKPGQVWTMRGAPNPAARVIVGRVEPFKGRMIAHISVRDLDPPGDVEGFGEEAELTISHIPIALEAAAESLSVMITPMGEISADFEEAFADWRAMADAGQAGIFVESIPEAIYDIFAIMRSGAPEKS